MPSISIIIPNRNYAKFLPDCLESVRMQTIQDWECIVIDDASTDNSCEVIGKFCSLDKRFRLIRHKECLGISASRNTGLGAALGDYISFLDSDDSFVETGLEILLNLALSTDADMVGAQTTIVPDNFKFIPMRSPAITPMPFAWQSKANIYLSWDKSFNWCWIWRRIYKRDLIGSTRFVAELRTLGDDLCFMLDICHKASRIVETPLISTYHRVHAASVTKVWFSERNFSFFPKMFRHIRENLLDEYDRDFWTFYFNDTFRYMIGETIFKPSRLRVLQAEARSALRESVRLIPKKYLNFKNRVFAWFLQW
ncbi:MAG: glycosyltransferase [Rickettsiales bacterium]|jgi:glycosyltransferase involved in cell wall biosynthesis|nr:glycosyltransferase [Rickettsiales bacterium]